MYSLVAFVAQPRIEMMDARVLNEKHGQKSGIHHKEEQKAMPFTIAIPAYSLHLRWAIHGSAGRPSGFKTM